MKVLILTNEYPPHVYGGAGVHVEHLSRELAQFCNVDVRCFGAQKILGKSLSITGYSPDHKQYTSPKPLHRVFEAVECCLDFNVTNIDADIVHVHTWYTHFGGILAKLNYSIPLVITTHSLEPLRPWKHEQLGGGYLFSCWVEKTAIEMADAVVAVSWETKCDILRLFNVDEKKVHVIHNGIDPEEYRPTKSPEKLKQLGINPRKPYVFFVGRITRQKGIFHFLNAVRYLNPDFQAVLYSSASDTPEMAAEMRSRVSLLKKERSGVVWIEEMVDLPTKVALYSHAAVFCCSSIYEPFGIINLEAMACECPVVASAVGGIKEVVIDGETGLLVPVEQKRTSPFEPLYPDKFAKDLAQKVNTLVSDRFLRRRMGKAGRKRAVEVFSWSAIAKKTHDLYQSVLESKNEIPDRQLCLF